MNYKETLEYLYASAPVYQHSGAQAYKPGLGTSRALDDYLGNPHRCYRTVHVAGTNGKGSVCHTLAAILQAAGLRTGLYTSPHLTDFGERIRVNGEMIDGDYVTDFVRRSRSFFEPLHPSFFELTSAMAFDYFRHCNVDCAVIEVGLGGRLDSTNIISTALSIITNISIDHTELLGNTLKDIAIEKAGIIKQGTPVVIGRADDETVVNVFRRKAAEMNAPLLLAQEEKPAHIEQSIYETKDFGRIRYGLTGEVQHENLATVLCALRELGRLLPLRLDQETVNRGASDVAGLTGLRGRWEKLRDRPHTIADTGHNPGAWRYITARIEAYCKERGCRAYMVTGFSNDKDVDAILRLAPREAFYIFTQAGSQRAMPAVTLLEKARAAGLDGMAFASAPEAVAFAMSEASEDDMVFIGGSNFIVAGILPLFG
ncbi:MAG: bifunctional folylpolyglutamate synthase/dihydrofolate synthase [Tannerellaceae bacterium]|jgi:dihydrofolate synthase/folylpolyglutamate synthase|nr:bifunctional folylpolyglutamate synthase/dihydrofolate synthase [Tannerellaceae bacterium]